MRIVVIGAGGIGGTLGACLTRAGLDVTPVTGNPEVARSLEEHGYRVRDFQGRDEWSVRCSSPPRVALASGDGPFDLCLLVTQSPVMESAAAAALPHLSATAPILCLQNGLPEERVVNALDKAGVDGAARVLGCVVGWGASMTEPGRYARTSSMRGVLALGRPSPRAPDPAPIAAILERGAPVQLLDDLAATRWSKLAINCVTSTLGAIGGNRLGPLLRHRFVRRIALEIWAEVDAVARASHVKPAKLAGTLDIARLAITDAERARTIGSPSLAYKHSIVFAVGLKYRRMRSSMLYAIERGRPPEIDFLNGEVVRRGELLGVRTPVNRALVETVNLLANKGGEHAPSLAALRAVYDRVVEPRAVTA